MVDDKQQSVIEPTLEPATDFVELVDVRRLMMTNRRKMEKINESEKEIKKKEEKEKQKEKETEK